MSCTVQKSRFLHEEAIRFENDDLEAVLVPGWGSNLISLRWKAGGLNLLKTPETKEEYDANPFLFGIPVLFPPTGSITGDLHMREEHTSCRSMKSRSKTTCTDFFTIKSGR